MKYIFVTGGVVSGLGKGISAASLGRLLKARGLKVVMQKFDPYLNIDPGAMSPLQHGEVFVTADGAECDLDLGHYERFIDENLNINSDVTTGQIYWDILNRERSGGYKGGTVQVIPHVTNAIKACIYRAGEGADALIVEIGGTVGDIECQPFLEAARQVSAEKGKENTLYIHLSLIVSTSGEQKSKPTQHSVKELLTLGIQPDIVICRADEPVSHELKEKIGLFCNIPPECVIQNLTAQSLYEIPLMLHKEGLDTQVCRILRLPETPSNLTAWRGMVDRILSCNREITIALVGKYIALRDAYLSTVESLNHGGFAHGAKVELRWVDAETLTEENTSGCLAAVDGIIVPGGFGDRGAEGMAAAARYARENEIPLLAIGMGMQMAAVEFTRSVCQQMAANSLEFGETPHPVARPLPRAVPGDTSTMRRGAHTITVRPNTLASSIYGSESIVERHRHYHYVCNREELEKAGIVVSGWDGDIPEILELPGHPFYLAAQFHPEFKSRPNHPHPLFAAFIGAGLKKSETAAQGEQ